MYQGKQGLVWFTGVVEDRNDPKALNRVRVRIYGAHTDDKTLIATPDLPWSEVLMPTTSPSLSGLGTTTHGLVEGSTVMGFWRDGKDQQDAVVMGSLIGSPLDYYKIDERIDDKGTRSFNKVLRSPSKGFNDPRLATEEDYDKDNNPDGKNAQHINRNYGLSLALDKSPRRSYQSASQSYPKAEYFAIGQEEDLDGDGVWSTDVNFLARGDTTQYPVINLSKGEPDRSNYVKPIYPFNHVHETESGHVIELDDTPEYERIHAHHRTGTRVEIDNTGTYVEKIVRDKYTLILGKDTVKIQGAVDIEVGDSITANAIAAAGGSEALSKSAAAGLVNEDGTLTDDTKQKLLDAGVTEEQIKELEAETTTIASASDTTTTSSTSDTTSSTSDTTTTSSTSDTTTTEEVPALKEALTSTTEEVAEVLTDVETAKEKIGIKTVIDTVESIDTETKAGVDSVVKEVSEAVGGLTEETEHVIDEFLREYDDATTTVAQALTDFEGMLENKKDELKDKVLEELGVNAVKEKLEEKLAEQIAKVEVLQAEITEKVTEKVTEVATKVLGEELGAKVGEIMTEQMTNAVTSVAFSAVSGILGSNLVNISVAGSTKIKSMGSTTVQSLAGSTNVTSALGTNITTLAGGTNITTLVGGTNVNCAAGVLTLAAPTIASTGIWNHVGPMNVTGVFNTIGPISSTVSLVAPLVAGAVLPHTHPIATGSSAGSTLPGIGV